MASKEQELAIKIAGKIENSFKNSIADGQKGLEKLASVAQKAAAVASAAFAAVKIGEFISDAAEEYATFEQSMANTAAVANASAEDYAKLEKAARDAGKATTFTAGEAADALGYMALAGWDVSTSTQALTPILQLAEATQADLATTSDQVTDSMSAMGLGVEELTKYLDVVVATNNNANTTASDLMDAFIGCGGAAKSAGMDFEETATALGILANNGIKGSEAGTALNSMLVRMTTKDKAIEAMDQLGVSVYDSTGNMRDMRQILLDVNNAMDDMSDSERNAYMSAIAGTNYYTQFGYLLEGVKTGADGTASAWDNLTDTLGNSKGALEQMDKSVTSTLQGSIARLQSAVSDFKITMIEQFGGPAAEIIDQVASGLPGITENFATMISALPTEEFVGGIGEMIGVFLEFVSMLADGASLTDAVAAIMSNDFGVELPGSVQTFLDMVQNTWDSLGGFVSWIKSTGETTLVNLKETFADHEPELQTIMDLLADLQSCFTDVFGGAKLIVGDLAENGLPEIVGALIDVLAGAADVLDKFVEWDGFVPTIVTLGSAIAGFKLAKMALEIGKVTKAMLVLNAAKIKDKTETIYLNALYAKDAIVKGASTVATWGHTAATTAMATANTVAATATTALGTAFTFLTSPIGLAIIAITAVIAAGVLLYKNWDTVKEKASQFGEGISNIFNNVKNKIVGVKKNISDALDGIKQAFSDKLKAAKKVVSGIVDKIKGVFDFEWSLPKLKLPHVSVSGGTPPYGIAGKGKLPKFHVEWYAKGGIMTEPTLFGMNGGNPMVGGEAGAEAIIPLSELWSNMKQFISNAVRANTGDGTDNALSALVGKLDDLKAGMRENSFSSLLKNITGSEKQNQVEVAGTGMTVTYAPVFNITGSGVTKDDVAEAERMSQEEFADLMEQWQRDNDRKNF